jgi:iron-sulfur cluster repair protein YtfE (RIC family)
MLRDKNLIPLSHQHQHALALCVRIERASPIPAGDVGVWQSEIAQIFQNEIGVHFAAEEQVVFPAAGKFDELKVLLRELLSDHADLRAMFANASACGMLPNDISALGERLSLHIRKEERQLFERMQQLMDGPELGSLGSRLQEALRGSAEACLLPSATTRLRAAK